MNYRVSPVHKIFVGQLYWFKAADEIDFSLSVIPTSVGIEQHCCTWILPVSGCWGL